MFAVLVGADGSEQSRQRCPRRQPRLALSQGTKPWAMSLTWGVAAVGIVAAPADVMIDVIGVAIAASVTVILWLGQGRR